MAKKFTELRSKMSPEAQERARIKTNEMLAALPLAELRQARHMSQEQLANALRVKQSSISKLEHRTDMYIHTLRSYIEAMGGQLEITAKFPDGEVRIRQFESIENNDPDEPAAAQS